MNDVSCSSSTTTAPPTTAPTAAAPTTTLPDVDTGGAVLTLDADGQHDPAEFLRVAAEVSRKKPILGLKTGRTLEGSRAVSSHTGGMIREDTTTELVFDVTLDPPSGITVEVDSKALTRLFTNQIGTRWVLQTNALGGIKSVEPAR